MRESFLTARWNTILSSGLGLVIAVFVIAVMMSIKVPLVSGDKANFLILAVLGMLLCFLGYSHSAMTFGWTNSQYWAHPISIIGMGLGVLALLLIVLTLGNIKVALISGYKPAFLALAIIIFVKLGLKVLQNIILEIKG